MIGTAAVSTIAPTVVLRESLQEVILPTVSPITKVIGWAAAGHRTVDRSDWWGNSGLAADHQGELRWPALQRASGRPCGAKEHSTSAPNGCATNCSTITASSTPVT